MAASTKGQEESAQKVKETASLPSGSDESRRRLPVGAYVSSVHVAYEAFEVGTGQVSFRSDYGAYFTLESHVFIAWVGFKFFKYLFSIYGGWRH